MKGGVYPFIVATLSFINLSCRMARPSFKRTNFRRRSASSPSRFHYSTNSVMITHNSSNSVMITQNKPIKIQRNPSLAVMSTFSFIFFLTKPLVPLGSCFFHVYIKQQSSIAKKLQKSPTIKIGL